MESSKNISMQNLSYTTCTRRDHLRFRLMVWSNSIEELRSLLKQIKTDNMDIRPISMSRPNIIFVYPGVGTAWRGMCKEFIETSLVFKDTLQEIDKYLLAFTGWSIMDKFLSEEDVVDDPFVNHIAICSCQIALTNTWIHLGVKPLAVVGQSVGEVAAAYASGALSLQQTISVIYHRSKVLQNCTGGAMAVVKNCNTSTVEEACKKIQSGKVNIAVYLSEVACTVSGDPQAVEELKTELNHNTKDALIFIDLKVKCAYHSHFTLTAGNKLPQLIQDISSSKPEIPVFSSVTGTRAKVPYYASAEYWADNVRSPVHFSKAISNASTGTKAPIFLEISPRPVLQAHLQNIFPNSNGNELSLASFRLKDERKTFLQTFSRLYETGVNFNWCNFMHSDAIFIDIPSYAYSKQALYLESEQRVLMKSGGGTFSDSKGLITAKPGKHNEFKLSLDEVNTPFVFEHIVDGVIIVPGAMYGEIGLELGHIFFQGTTNEMEVSWRIENPCIVQRHEKQLVSVICIQHNNETLKYKIISNASGTIFADGRVTLQSQPPRNTISDIQEIEVMMTKEENIDIYTKLQNLGFAHGKIFQVVKRYTSNDDAAFAEIELTNTLVRESYKTIFHPVIIDAMLQCCFPAGITSSKYKNSKFLPAKIGSLALFQHPVRQMFCYSKFYNSQNNALVANVLLLRPDGMIIAEMKDFEIKIVNGPHDLTSLSYVVAWDHWRIEEPRHVRASELFLVVFNREKASQFKAAVQKWKMRVQLFYSSNEEGISVILNTMKAKVTERSVIPSLVFIPGFTTDELISEKDVYRSVKRTCNFLMRLVQVFCNTHINVVCITERTQSMMSRNNENTNILGSELWGMARSIIREVKTFKLTMVDVSPSIDTTIPEIAQILVCITNGLTNVPPEIKISDSMFYHSKIKPLRTSVEEDNRLRIKKLASSDKAWIRTERKDCIGSAFGIPMEIETHSKNHCLIQCKSALICTNRNFFSNQKQDSYKDFWPQQMHLGYSVFACEVSGFIHDKHFQGGKSKREIISCSPTELGTEVSVLQDFVAFKSDIPEYTPGLLHKAILATSITDMIMPRSRVSVCHDKTYPGLPELVQILLQEKNCSVDAVLHESELNDLPSLRSTYVIVAVQQTTKIIDDYQNVFPNARYLISFKGCFPSVSIHETKRRKYINRIILDQTEIFCTHKLRACFTRIITWLAKLSKRNMIPQCQFANDDEIFNFHELRDFQVRMPQDLFLRRNAAYVVVGGLTGLGWLIVKFLASNGAKHVITMSRKKVDKEMTDRLTNIQRLHGVRISHFPVDICNLQLLTCTFEKIKETLQNIEIKGIFHGAGVTEDVGVLNMTTEKLDIPLKPKVLGTWNLHLVSLGMNLDYFIMHSSIVSIIGHEGQSNYGAANAFMDSLAAFRRHQGLPAQSINWGALEVGMTDDRLVKERLKMEGINNLTKQQICTSIVQCALSSLSQVCLADIRWDAFIPSSIYGNSQIMSRFSAVASSTSSAKMPRQGKYRLDLERYNILTRDEQMQTMIDIVHTKSANLFALHKSEIDPKSMLVDYGLDSQKTTELINSLYQSTRVRIPFVQLISGEITIEDLARFIVEQIQNEIESHGEDGFDEDMSFIAGSPSYMEKLYLDMLADDPHNPHLTITADYKISMKYRTSEFWKTVLQTLVSLNPELRTVFRVMDGEEKRWGLVKEVMDPEDTTVDFKVFQDKTEFQKALNEPHKHDPFRDFPMRVLFYEGTKYSLLRMVFSHCSIDLGSSLAIANDIRDIVLSLYQNRGLSANKKEDTDIAVIMEERLQPRLKTLETYWKSQLQLVSHKSSLKSDKGVSIRVTNSLYVSKIFEEQHVTRVQCYVQDVKQTFFSLICTIYQIVLHKHSKSNAISVISAVDLRNYDILEMRKRVGLGVNFIPLIADLRNSHLSLEQIFLQNCQVIKQGITNSLFPYEMLKNIDSFSKEKHSRHTIIIDDMTYLDDIQDEDVQLMHLGANQDRSYETALSVFYNKNRSYLELRLGFQRDVVQEYLAETILEDMEELMAVFLTDRKLTLDMWIPKYDVTHSLSPITESQLFKYNKKGGGHYVTLALVSSGGQTFLQWGKTNGRRLLMEDIHELKGRCIRGLPSIVLETNDMEHIFSSDNKRVIEAWIVKIWRTKERNGLDKN